MSEEEDLKYLETEYEENIITELIKKVESLQNQLQQKENIIKEVREYNEQIIKDTKDFYRPTEDIIYSGDCLIDIATQNLEILDKPISKKSGNDF